MLPDCGSHVGRQREPALRGEMGPQPGVRGSSAYCGVETVRWVPCPGPEAWEEGHRESTYESPPTLGLGRNKHVQLES